MKKLIIATAILASTLATSVSAEWSINVNNVAGALATNNSQVGAMISVSDHKGKGFNISFVKIVHNKNEMNCFEGETVISVNGQKIKAQSVRVGDFQCSFYPMTQKGGNFIARAFEAEGFVDWNGSLIPTKGFVAISKELLENANAL